jgi:hypothetical protein
MSTRIGSASDGSLELYSGSTKVLTADATTGVTNFVKTPTAPTPTAGTNNTQLATTEFAMGAGIGSNQTWQDVKANRALGTTYTNSTGKPIVVSFYGHSDSNTDFQIFINGTSYVIFPQDPNSHYGGAIAIIPTGATYKCQITSGSPTLDKWSELR